MESQKAKTEDDLNSNMPEGDVTHMPLPDYLYTYIEKSPDLLFVLSLRGLFIHVSNDPCLELLEYKASELIGLKISEIVHPSDLISVMRDLRNCSNDVSSANVLCRMKRKHSGFRYVEMNVQVIDINEIYNSSKRNRCFLIAGREQPIPKILASTFYSPELEAENEMWIKVSSFGLILYASLTCIYFLGVNCDLIHVHSIFDFIDQSEHSAFKEVLATDSDQVTHASIGQYQCLIRVLICDSFRGTKWLQIKKKPVQVTFLSSDLNLYEIADAVRSSSIHYECNRLKVKNSKLRDEINILKNSL